MSIENQMELLFSIKTGSFSIYVPGFASGHSSSALVLGQGYHPLPHIASILPGYWEGKALQCVTLLRLLSLGLTQLVLFIFLRNLKLNVLFSFLLSCITVYNLRMLDLFRYGASLETYTGFLLLCSAIGLYYIQPTRYRWPVGIIGATYLLICSGHPQMMYYCLLSAGLFLLVAPFFISEMLPEKHIDFKTAFRLWIKAGIYLGLGVLLSLCFILPFYFEFIATNTERVNEGYVWADSIRDTFVGTLNSFFLPLHSEVHGAFGGSSLIIVAALLPVLKFFKVKIPRSLWAIWVIILVAFLHMQGARTPIHRLMWEYLPFASTFRYAGRISIFIPFLIMTLLAWIVKSGPFSLCVCNRAILINPGRLLALVGLLVTIVYYLLFAVSLLTSSSIMSVEGLTPAGIRNIPRLVEILVVLCGISALLALSFYESRSHSSRSIGIILCFVTLLQIGSVLKYGTWIEEHRITLTYDQMLEQKKDKLDYRFYPGTGMYSSIVNKQLEYSFMEPYLGKIFTEVTSVSNLEDAYSRMKEERTPQNLFVEGYERSDAFISSGAIQSKPATVDLIYSSFNRLRFKVFSPIPAFFGLSYLYTGHWKAWVNEQKVRVYRANGSAHAIQIPGGDSIVEFRYWSPSDFWGMVISCATFTLTGLYFSLKAFGGRLRIAASALTLIIGVGGFLLWNNSLYNGDNLNTRYTWVSLPPSSMKNIAYGKKTGITYPLRASPGYLHSSLAVDGDRTPKSGFATPSIDDPAWTVDLYRIEKIEDIILYEGFQGPSVNIRPLKIYLSTDGKQWRIAETVRSKVNQIGPVHILFKPTERARYIRIQAAGRCSLRLDEVEIYGPGTN